MYLKHLLRILCTGLIILFAFTNICKAQEAIQTLKKRLADTPTDSLLKRCEIYQQLILLNVSQKNDSTPYFKNQLLDLLNQSKKPDIKLSLYMSLIRSDIVGNRSDYIAEFSGSALNLANSLKNYKAMARLRYFIGYYYLVQKQNFDSAVVNYIGSLRFARLANDIEMAGHVNSAFGKLYLTLQNNDSAYTYFKKAAENFGSAANMANQGAALLNLGGALAAMRRFEEAHSYYTKALNIGLKTENHMLETNVLFNTANTYQRQNKIKEAKKCATELYQKAVNYEQNDMVVYATTLLAALNANEKNYDASLALALEALNKAQQLNLTEFISSNYETIINNYNSKKDYKNAYRYLELKKLFDDSVAKVQNANYLEKLKGEYNLDLKNKELSEKNEMLRQNEINSRNKTIIIGLLVLLLTGLLVFFYLIKERRKTQLKLQLQESNYQKQQENFQSFINGQETERRRIASDLHDGLAQNLVMLSHKVSSSEPANSKLNGAEIRNEINLLINETRKIAHNMMPDVLTELGLQQALKSMLARMAESNIQLTTELEIKEPFYKINSTTEIQIYRIIQELLNNVIKHAEATHCLIVIKCTTHEIEITVSDNGKGFEQSAQGSSQGIGLKSIASRASSLGGSFHIKTNNPKGTIAQIKIPQHKQSKI